MFIGIAVVGILAVVAFFVLLPLVKNSPEEQGDLLAALDESSSIEKTKEAVFTTINEIEFDYKMKKLSDDDYEQLKNNYKQRALEILHEEDEEELETDTMSIKLGNSSEKDLENEIEQELAVLRKQQEK